MMRLFPWASHASAGNSLSTGALANHPVGAARPRSPFINAFVVGHSTAERTETVKTVGEISKARVTATTYAQLTRTVSKRLFRLRSRLSDRYERMSSDQLLDDLLGTTEQLDLKINGLKGE
jgi:hypothetical protein